MLLNAYYACEFIKDGWFYFSPYNIFNEIELI